MATADSAFCENLVFVTEEHGDAQVIVRFEIGLCCNIDSHQFYPQPPCRLFDNRERFIAQAASGPGQEHQRTTAHYRCAPMRPGTAAVIIGLLVLIMGSSLIWLLRSF